MISSLKKVRFNVIIKKSGKGVSFNLFSTLFYCDRFSYFIGSFWNYSDECGTSNIISWMDSFVCGAFENNYELLLSYILFYVKDYFSSNGNDITFLEKVFKVGILICETNSITMTGCHFIHTFRKIEESTFHSLYKEIKEIYDQFMKEKISNLTESLEKGQKAFLKEQEKNTRTFIKKEKEMEKSIAQNRAAIENIQKNFKKLKS